MMSTQKDDRKVVVGVDGSPEALAAVRWAAAAADRRMASLRLVSAFVWSDHRLVGRPGLGTEYRDTLLRQARAHLMEAAAVADDLVPGLEVAQHLAVGFPIGMLVSESRHAELVVVGDRGLCRIAAAASGSVAVGVATRAHCPVAVCHGVEPVGSGAEPVVVGVAGTRADDGAIAFAFEEAAMRGVPLIAVHTWGDPVYDKRSAPLYDVLARDAEELLGERLAGWNEKYPDVDVQRVVEHDRPARRLLALSETAQLVVVGSRGHGDFAGLVLGSVSNALVHRAGCPVVVARSERQDA